ncbi:exo-beta-N-acetylmuramidase NamZ family protein [Aureispira anguillae]|uniref:DUF1343 domain-containing protein n=1 Tax=Aureispira anguillae TaxID=2864201 RepID=A0A916DQ26_9BACT|nr:DUF1343 domain-containing protein [Aureispira anguillae]BDS09850.1 DUF1343 domain-containing protein [Aureispira anguillae]
MRVLFFVVGILSQLPLGWHFYAQSNEPTHGQLEEFNHDIVPAADQFYKYYHFIKDKRLGLVVNHTSMVGKTHLVDTLLKMNCQIQKIFAPEHGFRGQADAGEKLKDGVDGLTGIPIVSLYGKNKKPSAEQFENLDLVIFDVQDVGARFYTYTSTMTYVMETCAKNKVPLLILDRPNPNGHYVDGPILEATEKTFVGLHPVPIVHGLTVAEYARMINEEGWLENGIKCELYHVECLNYNHSKFYKLPVKPSPNLPNMKSIYLYPSLCWFEGTTVSVGRGTTKQFQVYGHPACSKSEFTFKPISRAGAKYPKHKGEQCKGYDLSVLSIQDLQKKKGLNLTYLVHFYNSLDAKTQSSFFNKNNFFDKLAGTPTLQHQLKEGKSIVEIQKSWQKDLKAYKKLRKKYLLYKDFE